MERFFNTFKEELTEALVYLHNIEELYEQIANWIYYYNHEQIHTILLTPPAEYAKQLRSTSRAQASLGMDRVSRKRELDRDVKSEVTHSNLTIHQRTTKALAYAV